MHRQILLQPIHTEPPNVNYADDCTIVTPVMKNYDHAPDLISQFVTWTEKNSMNCNPTKCKELIVRKSGHGDEYNTIMGTCQCIQLPIVGLIFQPDCRFSIHVRNKLVKANKSLFIIRSLRKEGWKQPEIDHLFRSIVLPNITYALAVYGAARPELATAQNFLDRCFKRRYVSERIDILDILEKQDKKIFNKVTSIHSHPLRPLYQKPRKLNTV